VWDPSPSTTHRRLRPAPRPCLLQAPPPTVRRNSGRLQQCAQRHSASLTSKRRPDVEPGLTQHRDAGQQQQHGRHQGGQRSSARHTVCPPGSVPGSAGPSQPARPRTTSAAIPAPLGRYLVRSAVRHMNCLSRCPLSARLLVRNSRHSQIPSVDGCVAIAHDSSIVVNVRQLCE